ncbi:MAG: HDOD domain-containing protein [Pseudomonadota bacterium]
MAVTHKDTPGSATTLIDGASIAQKLDDELKLGNFRVPMLPGVAAEVLASSLDDKTDAQQLAELIERDQSLAANILRVVNSPAFRGSVEIISLKQASARLGMERIREIALTVSMQGVFNPGGFEELLNRSWCSALASALWAKEVARFSRRNVELAYLCGLMHNISIPVIAAWLNDAKLASTATEELLLQLVKQFCERVAQLLVIEWQLPTDVLTAISYLRDVDLQTPTEAPSLDLAIVGLGCRLGAQDADQRVPDLMQLPIVQQLNCYPDDLEALLAKAESIQSVVEAQ